MYVRMHVSVCLSVSLRLPVCVSVCDCQTCDRSYDVSFNSRVVQECPSLTIPDRCAWFYEVIGRTGWTACDQGFQQGANCTLPFSSLFVCRFLWQSVLTIFILIMFAVTRRELGARA